MESNNRLENLQTKGTGQFKAVALANGVDFLGPTTLEHCTRAANILKKFSNKNKDKKKVLLQLTCDALHIQFKNESKPGTVLPRPFSEWHIFGDVMMIVTQDPTGFCHTSQALFAYKLKKPRDFFRAKAELDRSQEKLDNADVPTPKELDNLFSSNGSDAELPQPCDVASTSSTENVEPCLETNEDAVPSNLIDLNFEDPMEVVSKEFDALALGRCYSQSSLSTCSSSGTPLQQSSGSVSPVSPTDSLSLGFTFPGVSVFGSSDRYAPLRDVFCSEDIFCSEA